MTFHMNPEFSRQMSEQAARLKAAYGAYAGRPIEEVEAALVAVLNGVGNGASITDPDLTTVAGQISAGKRVWLEPDERIVSND